MSGTEARSSCSILPAANVARPRGWMAARTAILDRPGSSGVTSQVAVSPKKPDAAEIAIDRGRVDRVDLPVRHDLDPAGACRDEPEARTDGRRAPVGRLRVGRLGAQQPGEPGRIVLDAGDEGECVLGRGLDLDGVLDADHWGG